MTPKRITIEFEEGEVVIEAGHVQNSAFDSDEALVAFLWTQMHDSGALRMALGLEKGDSFFGHMRELLANFEKTP